MPKAWNCRTRRRRATRRCAVFARILAEGVQQGRLDLNGSIRVRSSKGEELFTLAFRGGARHRDARRHGCRTQGALTRRADALIQKLRDNRLRPPGGAPRTSRCACDRKLGARLRHRNSPASTLSSTCAISRWSAPTRSASCTRSISTHLRALGSRGWSEREKRPVRASAIRRRSVSRGLDRGQAAQEMAKSVGPCASVPASTSRADRAEPVRKSAGARLDRG